jgi:hypothetical protein
MNRPGTGVRIVFVESDDIGIVQFIGRQDAILAVGAEEDDRGHKGAGKVPGVLLGEAVMPISA